MTTHYERLKADLDLVRLIACFADDDRASEIAAIIEASAANLRKAKEVEQYYLRFDDAVESSREAPEYFGFAFTPPPSPSTADADIISADMAQLRGLLKTAVLAGEVGETRRLISLLIRAERRLWRECLDSGIYLKRDAAFALADSLTEKWIAENKPKYEPDAWAELIDKFLALYPEEQL